MSRNCPESMFKSNFGPYDSTSSQGDWFDGKDTSQKTTSQPENEESSLKLGEK